MSWRTGKPSEAVYAADRESLHRAVVLCERGNIEDAGDACEALLRRVPSYTEARHLLGVIISGEGHFEEAIEHFDQLLSLEPANP